MWLTKDLREKPHLDGKLDRGGKKIPGCPIRRTCVWGSSSQTSIGNFRRPNSLLKQILKRSSRIARPRRAARIFLRGAICRSRRNRRCILFNSHAHLEERAIILRAFFHDGFRYRLCAFKLCAGIEVHALFAAMKFVSASRANARRHKSRRQNISASAASCSQHRANHPRSARTYLFGSRTAWLLWSSFSFFGFSGILITVLLVFSIQLTLTTFLFSAKIARTNGLTVQRAAIGDNSRTVKLQNCARRCFLSAEILTGTTQR